MRLWHIPIGTLRRVFSEFGAERGFNFRDKAKGMTARFPPPLRSLRVISQAGLARHLQHRAPIPLGAAYIRWYGPWVGRWSGRDSDLFFVFTKYYHQLVSEHTPENTEMSSRKSCCPLLQSILSEVPRPCFLKETFLEAHDNNVFHAVACIPGFVPVLSQVLTVLESTIYRQAGQHTPESFASSSVDDVNGPDSVAPIPIPMTITNAARSMAENRLIMLLRDVTGDNAPDRHHFRDLYLRAFNGVFKAACRKVSLHNNGKIPSPSDYSLPNGLQNFHRWSRRFDS